MMEINALETKQKKLHVAHNERDHHAYTTKKLPLKDSGIQEAAEESADLSPITTRQRNNIPISFPISISISTFISISFTLFPLKFYTTS